MPQSIAASSHLVGHVLRRAVRLQAVEAVLRDALLAHLVRVGVGVRLGLWFLRATKGKARGKDKGPRMGKDEGDMVRISVGVRALILAHRRLAELN